MTQAKDYYQVLGVDRKADAQTIKKAYRRLAKQYHPDTNAGNPEAAARFKEITEAYHVLSDPEKKKIYDRGGMDPFAQGDGSPFEGFGGFSGDGGPHGYQEFHFGGDSSDMNDFFDGVFGDMFGSGASGRFEYGRRENGTFHEGFGFHRTKQKGRNIQAEMTVGLEEAFRGCTKLFRMQSGTDGSARTLQVQVPAGIEDGKCIRLSGQGQPGERGGEPGDLILKIHVADKAGFQRKGMDLYTTVSVPFSAAVLGGMVTVDTIDGRVQCTLRPGTQGGSRIRLRGKGMPSMKEPSVRGDQYITVQIQVPEHLSREAVRKLKEFEHACGNVQSGSGRGAA